MNTIRRLLPLPFLTKTAGASKSMKRSEQLRNAISLTRRPVESARCIMNPLRIATFRPRIFASVARRDAVLSNSFASSKDRCFSGSRFQTEVRDSLSMCY